MGEYIIPRSSAFDRTVMSLCSDIDQLEVELEEVIRERDEYKRKYEELLDSSIKHSEAMSLNMLKFALSADENKLRKNFKEE